MSLLGDLEQVAFKGVMGGSSNKTTKKATTKSGRQKTSSKGGAQATITNDLIDMASSKIKDFTPDSIDNIIDDLSSNFKK